MAPLALRLVPVPGPDGASLLGLPSLCIWKTFTGISCPGCGMLRSLVCLAHGDVERAMAFHPLGPPMFLGLIVWCLLEIRRWQRPEWTVPDRWRTLFNRACWATIVVAAVLWLIRLLGWLVPAP